MADPKLERILVPLDGSDLSERILAQVSRLLHTSDCEVMLVRVLPEQLVQSEAIGTGLVETAQRHLDKIAKRLAEGGATVRTEVLAGEPAARILAFALEYDPSLIAMSTHGRTGLARWTSGSVAERVLRHSKFPLLLANPFGLAEKDEQRFRRILVPLDGSELSAQVLPLVSSVARLYGSEVVLLTVVEPPATEYPMNVVVMNEQEAQGLLEGYAKRLAGIPVRTRTVVGLAASSVLDVAEWEKADLVAMTTHGRSGLSRWAFGSVAEKVVRKCTCPLLVVRTAGLDDREWETQGARRA